jgi:hypothetical protein
MAWITSMLCFRQSWTQTSARTLKISATYEQQTSNSNTISYLCRLSGAALGRNCGEVAVKPP